MRLITIITLAAAVVLAGCNTNSSAQQQEEQNRAATFERASKSVPTPHIENFQNREAVKEYMERMDDPDKTFYTYILSMRGDVIGYYVTRTHPVSICQAMTPTKKEYDTFGKPGPLGPAPTLDGLFTSGGSCDHYYAFTAGSDALIEFSQDFFISDQPLDIEADRLAE